MNTPLKLALPVLLFLSFFQGPAPRPGSPATDSGAFCAQAELHRQKMQMDDTYRRASQRLEEQLFSLAQTPDAARGPLVRHTLPVVVHIIHDGGAENISDAQVADAMQHLNDAFANVGYYNPATGVDTEIAFCLARRGPQGNATTGINRVQSTFTNLNNSTDDQAMKDLSRWDPTQYINIWVVSEICSNNGCGVAGYAYLPGAHGQAYDGIVLEAAYMGSNPTNSTVLVHEMGHYLGLYHTFEGGCPNGDCQQEGDRVCDTPPDNTTARTPCSADMNSCDTDEDDTSLNNPFRPVAQGGLGDQVDMKENYMDYSRLECYDRFSQGQKERMLNVVETIRSSLLDSPACVDPCPSPVEAAFTVDATSVPAGTTVNFTNTSSNADGYEWRIDGVIFGTSANASYTFNTAGSYNITLLASSSLPNCLPADSTITIEVFCPVEAAFDAGATSVLAGASVTFTNTSTNATAYTWLVNGAEVSTDPDFVLNTTQAGFFNVCLRAEGPFCESLECVFIEATSPTSGGGCGNTFFYTLGDPGISETADCLLPAADGGFYLGGSRGGQSLLMKFDENENVLWQKAFAFSNSDERVAALIEDGPYLVGAVALGDDRQYCFKYDTNTESFVWMRSVATEETNRTYDIINAENAPHYIMAGVVSVTGGQGCDVAWMEMDKNTGNIVQYRKHHLGSCESAQDAVLVDDKVYVTGRYNAAGGGTSAMRAAITEFGLDGAENWTRLYLVNTNTSARLYSNAILEDDGALVVCGSGDLSGTSTSSVASYVFKTALDGAIEWATVIDIPGGSTERFANLVEQGDGYLAIGFYTPTGSSEALCLVKLDKSGNLMWAKTLDSNAPERAAAKAAFTRDGYAYLATNLSLETGGDIHLFKIDPNGELDGDCAQLQPLEVETRPLTGPFDGFYSLDPSAIAVNSSAGQSNAADVALPADTLCYTPCVEICNNSIDDDEDGLVDCEDDDCPCAEDCEGTFVQLLGTPGQNEGALTIIDSGDGNFFVGGFAGDDAAILKMAPDGAVLWQRTFDFSEGADEIRRLILGDDGYLYGSSSNTHAAVFCYDPENDIVRWSNSIYDNAKFNNLSINPVNGNIMACGGLIFPSSDPVLSNEFPGTWYPQFDIAIMAEFDRSTGALNWHREYQAGSSSSCYEMEWVGNIYYSPSRFTHTSSIEKMRANITAFRANGEVAWAKHYITPADITAREYAFAMERASDGLVTGFLGDPNGTGLYTDSRTGLFKTDFAGNLQWAKWYELDGYDAFLGTFGMTKAPDGYLLYGFAVGANRNLTVVKTDESGNALWAMAYGGNGDEDVIFNAGAQILQKGRSIYLVGRSSDGDADMIIIRASAEDGSIPEEGCAIATPIPITTYPLPNAIEAPTGLAETPFSAISPQFNAVQPAPTNLITTTLCVTSAVDLSTAIDSAYCDGAQLAAALRICNEGTDTLPVGIHFTFYDGNPTTTPGATVLEDGLATTRPIPPGDCYDTTISVPFPQGMLYCIANDEGATTPVFGLEQGFPVADVLECDYTNNLDSASYDTSVPEINLGPDTSVCENGVFLLDAGPGFATYRWQDGSVGPTYTTYETGTFWVEGTTSCGDVARDTINILLDPVVLASLGADSTICAGTSATLATVNNPDYSYQWSPAGTLDCTDCASVTAMPDSTTTYTLVASNTTGCVSVDSITLTVATCDATLDTAICANDSVLIAGEVLYPNETAIIPLTADSNLLVIVTAVDTALTRMEVVTCFGEPYVFEGMTLPGGSVTPFVYTAANGCDSTLLLTVRELEEIQTFEVVQACQGDTGIVFGQPVTEPGVFSETYPSYQGCDSTHTITFEVLDTAILNIPPGRLGCVSLTGSLTVEASGGTPPYSFLWNDGQTAATATGLPVGPYSVTATDAAGCQSTGTQQVLDEFDLPAGEPIGIPVSCFGEADGGILVDNPSGGTPPYEYSLDGEQWQAANLFTGLEPGAYVIFIRDQELCQEFYTIAISEPAPLSIFLPGDTTLRLGDSVRLSPLTVSGSPSFFEWAPPLGLNCADCRTPIARPLESTRYRLTVRDSSGCATTEEVFIDVDKNVRNYVPNAFSPNEDGRNDRFTVFAGPEVEQVLTLQVFGRWGEQLFKNDNFLPNQEGLGWDGTFRGQRMPSGVYAYFVELMLVDGTVEVVTGEVVLVR